MATLLDIVKKGSTDRSVCIRIIDSGDGTPETGVVYNTSGIDLWYRREGAAVTSITEATLAALTTAHADGGFLHVSNGEYRLDLPDAAFATGANYVDIGGTVTGMIVIGGRVRLVNYDPEDTVRLGLTALPNAASDAAGGLPISDAGGLDLDARLDAAISSRQVSLWAAASSTVSLTNTTIANVSAVTSVAALGTGAITAASIATDAIDADALATDAVNEIRNAITGGAYDLDTDANGRIRVVDGTAAGEINTASGVVQAALADGVTHGGTTADFLARDISIGGDVNVVGSVVLDNAGNDIRGIQVNGLTTAGLNAIFNHVVTGNVTNSTLGAIINDLEDGGRTDLLIDGILEDTGTTIPALFPAGFSTLTIGSNRVSANIDAITSGVITRSAFAADTGLATIRSNTAQAGAAGTITLDASANANDDFYNDTEILITGGTGIGQVRHISDYDGTTKVATVKPNWTTTPDNTSTFAIRPAVSAWDHVLADHLDSGSAGASLNAAGSAGDPWTTALPGAYGAGSAGYIIGNLVDLSAADVTAAVWHSLVASNDNTIGSFGEQFAAIYQAATVDIQSQIAALNDLDAAGIRAAIGLASANLDTQLDALPTANEVRNAVTGGAYALDTDANGRVRIVDGTGVGEIDTNGGAIASVLALGTQAKADVNAEVVDCLNVDTYAQASQGTPPATASIAANITMLAKFARNKRTQASGYVNIFNDDATTVDHKSAVSDDGTTFTAGEFATGP